MLVTSVDSGVVTVTNAVRRDGGGLALPLAARAVGCAVVPGGGARRGRGGVALTVPLKILDVRIRVWAAQHQTVRRHQTGV